MDHKNKKTLGILGGMGSHASSWLLQRIISLSGAQTDQDNLEIILHNNSRIPDRTRAILYDEPSPLPELKRSVDILNCCHAEVAILACMTAHFYYPELRRQFRGTLLDTLDIITFDLMAKFPGAKKLGLIGSTGMVSSNIFQNRLEPLGYEVMLLSAEEHQKYFMGPLYRSDGVKSGTVNKEIRGLFLRQMDLFRERGADVVIGACSEVPLMVDADLQSPFVNVFELLAAKAVEYCYNN